LDVRLSESWVGCGFIGDRLRIVWPPWILYAYRWSAFDYRWSIWAYRWDHPTISILYTFIVAHRWSSFDYRWSTCTYRWWSLVIVGGAFDDRSISSVKKASDPESDG